MNAVVIPAPGKAFVASWTAATAVGWLLAHPLVQLFALDTIHVWGTAAIAIVVIATVLYPMGHLQSRWRSVLVNAAWTLVAVVCLALGQPGSIAGVLQWLALRPHLPTCRWWMLASGIGAYVAFLVLEVVVTNSTLLVYAIAGMLIGAAQWPVLRRRVAHAGWWVAASAVGYVVGGAAALTVGTGLNGLADAVSPTTANALAHTLPNLSGGLLCGAITALWLARLLRVAPAPLGAR
jgi:hypothetical protein